MEPLVLAAAAATAGWYFLIHKKSPAYAFQPVTGGVTKKPWLTRVTKITGSGDNKVTTVELYAPAGSWGPHQQLLVATYQQKGSNLADRKALSFGQFATPEMVTAAGQDFGIQKPATTVSGPGGAPDDSHPIISASGQIIGRVHSYHDGQQWAWRAKSGKQTIGTGTARTLASARAQATQRARSL